MHTYVLTHTHGHWHESHTGRGITKLYSTETCQAINLEEMIEQSPLLPFYSWRVTMNSADQWVLNYGGEKC